MVLNVLMNSKPTFCDVGSGLKGRYLAAITIETLADLASNFKVQTSYLGRPINLETNIFDSSLWFPSVKSCDRDSSRPDLISHSPRPGKKTYE